MNVTTPISNPPSATHIGTCGCERLGICQDKPDCALVHLERRQRLLTPPAPQAGAFPFAPGIIDAPLVDDGWFWPLLERVGLLAALVGLAGFCAGFLTGCPIP